jgi:predicted ATP-binding protein involved in virulence
MKIRSLHLKGIGVFKEETISFPEKKDKELAEIHILTGQNGTGKTTILQALASSVSSIAEFDYPTESNQIFTKKFLDLNSSAIAKFDQDISAINNIQSKIITSDIVPLNITAFAYSGYRFVEHQENITIKEKPEYNPLSNALEFNKAYRADDYTLNEWLANRMAQRNSAFFENNQEEVEKYSQGINNLKLAIEAIIETPIDFKFKNEKLKVVVVKKGVELDFDVLPDGLRSVISWIGDLLMRMDALKWENDLPVFEREFILFLDEIEVHLHPSWQRKILPVVQKLFKNAQIFITTHSPFIVNSVDGAYIYELKLNDEGNCYAEQPPHVSSTAMPIDEVLEEIYNLTATQMY